MEDELGADASEADDAAVEGFEGVPAQRELH